MALSASMAWDVRTTGNDTYGGGFDTSLSGTDYSQQASPQWVYTDLVIGATTTHLTSSARPFVSTDVGNVINITGGSGFTTGRYEITSISGSAAVMDRSVGTNGSTSGTGNFGGSLLTIPAAFAATVGNSSNIQNIIWVQSGTYTLTSAITLSSWPVIFNGYGVSHGDNASNPLITTTTNSVHIFSTTGAFLFTFIDLNLSNMAGTPGDGIHATSSSFASILAINCNFNGFAVGIHGDSTSSVEFADVWVSGCGFFGCTQGISTYYRLHMHGCFIQGCTTYGAQGGIGGSNYPTEVFFTVFNGNGDGLYFSSSGAYVHAFNCSFYGQTGSGIHAVGTGNQLAELTLVNNIFYGNASWGVFASVVLDGQIMGTNRNNAYGSNTLGSRYGFQVGFNDISLGSNPFNNSSSGNFSLATGSSCRLAGFPGTFPGGTSVGYLDIGAVQSSGNPSTNSGAVNSAFFA